MNEEDRELADFQACLLNALHEHDTAESILAAMSGNDATLPFRDYITGFEPEMLELAAILVKKWGVKTPVSPSGGLQKMPH